MVEKQNCHGDLCVEEKGSMVKYTQEGNSEQIGKIYSTYIEYSFTIS
jgi:hypothetical protein